MSPTTDALETPQLRAHIASFLHKADLHSCRLLNQAWHQSLEPYFWLHVLLDDQSFPPALLQNTHHVQHLVLADGFRVEACTLEGFHHHFKELSICLDQEIDDDDEEEVEEAQEKMSVVAAFIRQQCGSVERLELLHENVDTSSEGQLDLSGVYLAIREGCPGLQSLSITAGQVSVAVLTDIWATVCEVGVENLVLEGWSFEDGEDGVTFFQDLLHQHEATQSQEAGMADGPRGQVRYLDLSSCPNMDGNEALALFGLLPRLQRLTMGHLAGFPKEAFCMALKDGTWGNLDSLVGPFETLTDEQMADMIMDILKIQQLGLTSVPSFGSLSFSALQTHPFGLALIHDLYVGNQKGSMTLTSSMIQTILEEAPCLKRLYVGPGSTLRGQEIIEGGPWACASTLQSLTLDFWLSSGDQNRDQESEAADATQMELNFLTENRAILDRLSTLTRLETLSSTAGRGGRGSPVPVQGDYAYFNLAGGLDQLKTLKRLKSLTFPRRGPIFGVEEVEWMVKAWPRLEGYRLFLPREVVALERQLEKRIEERGYLVMG